MIAEPVVRRISLALLIVFVAFTAGCSGAVDADEIPGVYRNPETGGEIHLEPDGTFSASGISADEMVGSGGTDPREFGGRWDAANSTEASDFVYLIIDDEGLEDSRIGGVQLYLSGGDAVEFFADVDGPPSLVLERQE
jgi:hypothetical protein